MFAEFKKFLISGNVIDMAVGFIFGAAFATVVKSLVSNIIMPPVGLLMGGVDFSSLFIALDGKEYVSLAALEAAGAPAIKLGVFANDLICIIQYSLSCHNHDTKIIILEDFKSLLITAHKRVLS